VKRDSYPKGDRKFVDKFYKHEHYLELKELYKAMMSLILVP